MPHQEDLLPSSEMAGFISVTHTAHVGQNGQVGRSPAAPLFTKLRRRRALLWGIVSTVLSAIGFIGLALFEQYNGMLSELRADLKHFNETSSDYVKNDRFQKCWEMMKELSKDVGATKASADQLERELKVSTRLCEDQAKELQRLRERLAYLEGFRAARPNAISALPERPANGQ